MMFLGLALVWLGAASALAAEPKPSATSEYKTPAIRPLISTSIKKPIKIMEQKFTKNTH